MGKYSNPQTLSLTSEPASAQVITSAYGACKTPCSLVIDAKKDFQISVKAEGYEDIEYITQTSLNFVTLLNLFFGSLGFIFMGIDYYYDEFFALGEDELFFELSPLKGNDKGQQSVKAGKSPLPKPTSVQPGKSQPSPTPHPADGGLGQNEHQQTQGGSSKNGQGVESARDVPLRDFEKKRLMERFPREEVFERVTMYYGQLSTEELKTYEDRIYRQLKIMEQQGEKLDLDEAVRRDWFMNQGKKEDS